MDEEKLKQLHQALVAAKYSVPDDYGTFAQTLSDPNKAKVFHEQLVKDKFSVPEDYEQFSTALGLSGEKKKDLGQPAGKNAGEALSNTGLATPQDFSDNPLAQKIESAQVGMEAKPIEEFADRITSGNPPQTPQDLQFYQNNKKAIDETLASRMPENIAPESKKKFDDFKLRGDATNVLAPLRITNEEIQKNAEDVKLQQNLKEEYLRSIDNNVNVMNHFAGNFNKAVIDAAVAIPKSIAVLSKELDDKLGTRGLLGEGDIANVEDYATYKAGQWLQDTAEEFGITKTNPAKQEEFWSTAVPSGLGSVAAIAMSGLGKAASSIPAQMMARESYLTVTKNALKTLASPQMVTGGTMMGVQEFEQARKAGLPEDEAFKVFLQNFVIGTTDALPIGRAFERLNKLTNNGVANILKNGAVGGAEEMIQESVQNFLTNLTAKDYYDKSRDLFDGMATDASAGFVVGFLLSAIGGGAQRLPKAEREKVEKFLEEKKNEIQGKVGFFPTEDHITPTAPEGDLGAPNAEDVNKIAPDANKVAPDENISPKPQKNAIPEQSTDEVPVRKAPGDSEEVGIGISGSESGQPAGTQEGRTVPPTSQTEPKVSVSGEGSNESKILKVKDHPVADLNVDVKRFQNRNDEFSESSVNSIVDSIKDGSFDAHAFLDPVRVWTDPNDNKTYVLSGHSRTKAFQEAQKLMDEGKLNPEAIKNLKDQGIDNFKEMPVIDLTGKTEEQAINIGLTGNQKATQETELEGAKIARKLRTEGKSQSQIRRDLGNRANISRLLNFSHLNPEGKTFQALKAVEKAEKSENKNAVNQVGEFIGEARAKYPQLTDSHENELYDYLTTGAGKKYTKRADFLEEIDRRVGSDMFFNKNEPLNMNDRPSIGFNESEIKTQRDAVEKELRQAEKERKIETVPLKLAEHTRNIERLNKELLRLNQEMYKAREGDRSQTSMFGSNEESKPASPEVPKVVRRNIERKKDAIDDAFADLDKILGIDDVSNMGAEPKKTVDPKVSLAGAVIVNKYVEMRTLPFEDMAKDVYDRYGEAQFRKYFPALKSGYGAMLAAQDDFTGLTQFEDLKKIKEDDLVSLFQNQTPTENDRGTTTSLEPNSGTDESNKQVGKENVPPAGEQNRPRPAAGNKETGSEGIRKQGDTGFSDRLPAPIEQPANPAVDVGSPEPPITERIGRGSDDTGRPGTDGEGVQSESGTNQQPASAPAEPGRKRLSLKEKQALQEAADRKVKIIPGDRNNIAESLPVLIPHQIDNVLHTEQRFLNPPAEGEVNKGIMFTDGTGTGKTFTGLGIAKRWDRMGKTQQLIVVPTDQKVKDWIEDGKFLGLDIHQLNGVDDAGDKHDKVITTYANFRQNEALMARADKKPFHLVFYDEGHRLVSNQQGTTTAADQQHKQITNSPTQALAKATAKYQTQIDKDYAQFGRIQSVTSQAIKAEQQRLVDQTKVVFLTASPFAYRKNLTYADGYLFTIREGQQEPGKAYNAFFIKNFGYYIKYSKLYEPEVGVDVGVMERQFHTQMIKSGAVRSTRLAFDKDYSRDFILMDDKLGLDIDEGYKLASEQKDSKGRERIFLPGIIARRFNWLYQNQLMEAIKAKHSIDRIQKHMDLGRKIIVFHNYNDNLPKHPFDLNDPTIWKLDMSDPAKARLDEEVIKREIADFHAAYPKYQKLDLSDLNNPIQTLSEAFKGRIAVFNGTVSKTDRSRVMKQFNADGSGIDLIVIQTEAGKEGISLHDVTGKHARVMINMGLPYKPTDAIQTEGRPYRYGLESDVALEYAVLHTSFEKNAFGLKINARISTAENLAFGEAGRNLGKSFKDGYNNPIMDEPSTEKFGKGGKEKDGNFDAMDEFEKAKTYYISRGKRNAKTKAREGVDYYATPEPLGYKMVEWLNAKPNGKLLEPSAGHGAIGRFFPDYTANKFIEPSYELRADLSINTNGEVIAGTFEDHDIINKYDGIAMNPPYGASGKTAMDHVVKALKQLRNGGRLIAIVPDGPSMNKRLETFFESEDSAGFHQIATIKLPSVTFERAGTSVLTQVLILDKQIDPEVIGFLPIRRDLDLRYNENINEFFDSIKELTMAPRVVAAPKATPSETIRGPVITPKIEGQPPSTVDRARGKGVSEIILGKHTKEGYPIATVKLNTRVSEDDYRKINTRAEELGGYYSRYNGGGAIRGFVFKGENRIDMANELNDYIIQQLPQSPTDDNYSDQEFSNMAASPAKGKIKNHEFEPRPLQPRELINADTNAPFQIYQAVVDMVHKYNPDSGLVQGGKYVSRGAEGTFYRGSANIAVRGLNNLSVAMHELTHAVDKRYGVIENFIKSTKITDPLRKRLTDLYVQYYPKASAKHPLRLRMLEGYATLAQKYIESPTEITKNYADLVDAFLKPKGAYYFDSVGEFLADAENVVKAYQQTKPLEKMASRIVYDEIKDPKDGKLPWMSRPDDYILYQTANNLHPIESMMKYLGLSMTAEDLSNHMRMANNYLSIVNHNVNSVRYGIGFKGGAHISRKETYMAMGPNGDFKVKHNFNFNTIARSVAKRGLSRDWSAWLYARRVEADYQLQEDYEQELIDVGSPEYLKDLEDNEGLTADAAIARQAEEVVRIRAEIDRVSSIINQEGIDRKTAEEAVTAGADIFEQEAEMFDKLQDEDLALANHPLVQLLDPETMKRVKKNNRGYAPFKRVIYNELNPDIGDVPALKGGGKTKISSLMQRKGGEGPILDPFVSATLNHAEFMRKAMKQIVYNKLFETVKAHQDKLAPAFQIQQLKVNPDESNRYPQEKDKNIIMARSNYKRAPILSGGLMKEVIDENFDFHNHHLLEKALITGSQTFRAGTTGLFVPFAVTNFLFLDQITAFTNSRNGMIPYGSTAKQLTRAALDPMGPERQYLEEYMALSGLSHTSFGADFAANRKAADVIKGTPSFGERAIHVASLIPKALSLPGNVSELATRVTEYIMARKNGKPQSVAIEEAGRVSAPFHHKGALGGSVGTTAIRSVPYLNSSIQVLTQTGESLKTPEGRLKYGITVASMMAAAVGSTLWILGLDDDDERKQALIALSPEEQTKYIHLPSPYSKRLLRFRVGEQYGSLTALANMMMIESAKQTNYAWYEYAHAGTNFLPTAANPFAGYEAMFFGLTPQLIKPSMEVLTGKKTYPEVRDIENFHDEHLEPRLRFNKYTSPLAVKLGDELNWSPKKIDHFIEGTFGRTARIFTGKVGAEQAFGFKDIFSRELYFDASRQVQYFYDVKKINDQEMYQLTEELKEYSEAQQNHIEEVNSMCADIEQSLLEYREFDKNDMDEDAKKSRDQIFQMVKDLEKMKPRH